MAAEGVETGDEWTVRQTSDITILLVGQTGHGKSATGNSILGKKAFVSKLSPGSVTRTIERAVAVRKGRRIEIVDSPGFADTSEGKEFVRNSLTQAVLQTLPGFNAIVFVLYPDRFTDELVKTVNLFFEFFGKGVGKFAFILFTHIKSKEKMNEYIQNAMDNPKGNVQTLSDLIETCESKVLCIDNEMKNAKIQVMVNEIIRTIDANTVRLGQNYFTNEMFQEAMEFADKIYENVDISQIEKKRIRSSNTTGETKNMNKHEKAKTSTDDYEQKVSRIRQMFEPQASEIKMVSRERPTRERVTGAFSESLNMKLQEGFQRANRDQEVVHSSGFEPDDAEPVEVPGRKYDKFKEDVQANKISFDRVFSAFAHWFDRGIKRLSKLF